MMAYRVTRDGAAMNNTHAIDVASFVGVHGVRMVGVELSYTLLNAGGYVDHVGEGEATHVSLYARNETGEAEWVADFPKAGAARAVRFAGGYASFLDVPIEPGLPGWKAAPALIICDTPDKVAAFRLLSLRGRLQLELKGMRFRRGSTFSVVKREFGLHGSRTSVLAQFETILRNKGVLA